MLKNILSQEHYQRLACEYLDAFGIQLLACDNEGNLIYGPVDQKNLFIPSETQFLKAIEEAARWGAPSMIMLDSWDHLGWGIPIFFNQKLLGGLVTVGVALRDENPNSASQEMVEACQGLFDLALRENLTNASLLQTASMASQREREKAEAIHMLKAENFGDIRRVYLLEEPSLIAAIRSGNQQESRLVLNRILAAIYHFGMKRFELLKSYLLELICTVSRTAVEAGGSGEKIWDLHMQSLTQLNAIEDDEALSSWLVERFELLFNEIQHNCEHPNAHLLAKARKYIEENLHLNIKREDVARYAGFSVSHFSYLMSSYYKQTFRDMLTEIRVEKAGELLRKSNLSMTQITQDCGFSDQSHFSRTFKRLKGCSPMDYR